jgi:deoxyribonuclease V
MPWLLAMIHELKDAPEIILIDGYVWLNKECPGLGAHLYHALNSKIPVIGVAKSHFKGNDSAIELVRGNSSRPLYITSAGVNCLDAANYVKSMRGANRIPDLLKRADMLSRRISQPNARQA